MLNIQIVNKSIPVKLESWWKRGAVLYMLAIFVAIPGQAVLAEEESDTQVQEDQSAPGQGASDPGDDTDKPIYLEEVVVTARKREEPLQETPISISVFGAEELKQRNLTNLVQVSEYTPNVVMANSPAGSGGGSNAQIHIRGIGQTDFLFTTDPGVGIYMDGVYLPRTLGGVLDLLDLERIEILRGPQGTLFGKNTIGGAINLVSNKPTQEFGGYAEATIGSFNRTDARLDMNIPLSYTWASRFSLSYKNRDGYVDRLEYGTDRVLDNLGNENAINARASLRWKPSEKTTLDLILDYTQEREESVASTLVEYNPLNGLAPLWNGLVGLPSGSPMTSDFITGNPHTTYGTGPNRNNLDVFGLSMTFEHEFAHATLKSITAYREMDAAFGRDGDGSPNQYVETDQKQTQEQFSQEFQLFGISEDEKFNWLTGVFFMQEQGTDRNDVRLASGLYDALEQLPGQLSGDPCTPPWVAPGCPGNPINSVLDLDFDIYNKIDITSYAIFAQLGYQLSERWNINGGIRFTDESKDYTLEHLRVNSGVPIVPFTVVKDSWSEPSGKLGLDFQVTEDVMLYGSVSQGFKSGGFNGRPTTNSEVESFDPEFVTTYETGLKSEFANNRVRLNAAVFYMDYTDMQVGSVSADETGNLILIIDNAAESQVKGFEIDFMAFPSAHWFLSGSVGYVDAEYTDTGDAVGITLDSEFVKTPKWSTSAAIQYVLPLGLLSELKFRGDWSYRSKMYSDIQNTESIATDALHLFSGRITWSSFKHNIDVVLSGTNLTDEVYIINGLQTLDSFGTAEAVYSVGRQWGLTLSKRF